MADENDKLRAELIQRGRVVEMLNQAALMLLQATTTPEVHRAFDLVDKAHSYRPARPRGDGQ